MNQYLQSANKRFDERFKQSFNINPISKVDAEIMIEIKEIFRKLGRTDICAVLDEYKFFKDTEIRDLLLQWNIDNPNNPEGLGEGDLLPKSRVIEINGERINVDMVFGWQGKTVLNIDHNKVFCIKLNPTTDEAKKVSSYANKIIKFTNKTERDAYLRLLDQLKSRDVDMYKIRDEDE